jgi:hypothetical protein
LFFTFFVLFLGFFFIAVSGYAGEAQVAAGSFCTVGLKTDGTVIAVPHLDVESWTNIQQVAVGTIQVVGLRTDGTVVAMGSNDVASWRHIQQVAVGGYDVIEHTVGLKSDGTVVGQRSNWMGESDMYDWNLQHTYPIPTPICIASKVKIASRLCSHYVGCHVKALKKPGFDIGVSIAKAR